MATYRFKDVAAVPEAREMVDLAFSATQSKTPTKCHAQWKIARIRKFYTRKAKFCGQTTHGLLTRILDDFPRISDVHPFYGQLMDVIYNKDHYKVALGQINRVRGAVTRSVEDSVRLIKYADSQFKCKALKTACFGKIATYLKKLAEPLKYLEECRKHMSRLPQINPSSRSLICCGYPNVGKSSFMNLVSQANVEVEPYAFTTKAVYVGHFDYNNLRWQVLDTPGLLDRENMRDYTTAENQAITALGYIQATIVFIVDVSEECGYSIEQQVQLFHKVKELFKQKPVLVVLNKSDLRPSTDLNEEEKRLIDSMAGDNVEFADGMSTLEGTSVHTVRDRACSMLLDALVSRKASSKRVEEITARLTVVVPKKGLNPRRVATVPDSVIVAREIAANATEDDMMDENNESKEELLKDVVEREGGVGVFQLDTRKEWLLDNDDWLYDDIPEIYNGHNIADFVDPELQAKLAALEEAEAMELAAYDAEDKDDGNWDQASAIFDKIRSGIALKRMGHKLKMGTTGKANLKRKSVKDTAVEKALSKHGFQLDGLLAHATHNKFERHNAIFDDVNFTKEKRRPQMEDVRKLDDSQFRAAQKAFHKHTGGMNRAGPGDKEIHTKRPKHLFSGKRGFDTDRR